MLARFRRFLSRHQPSLTAWLWRLLPSLLLILFLEICVSLYNQWAALTQFWWVRRSVSTLGFGVLLYGPAILMRRRPRYLYLAGTSLFISLLFIAHTIYAHYAGGFLSISALKYFGQIGVLGSSITAIAGPKVWAYLVPPLALGALALAALRRPSEPPLSPRTRRWTKLSLALTIVLSLAWLFTAEAIEQHGSLDRIINQPYNSDELVRKIGIVNYTVYDTLKYILRKHGLSTQERAFVTDHKSAYQYKPTGTQAFATDKGRNLIYIQLESFQAFLIGLKINGHEVTPNLNKLASESLDFTNFHYMVGPGTSSDAEFTALNSLYYLGDRAVAFEYPHNNYQAMPKTLRDNGYYTIAMHGDSRNFWNRANTFPSFGYDRFDDVSTFQIKQQGLAWGLSDQDLFTQALPKLQGLKTPYYAHLITFSSHTPFSIPDQYKTLDLGKTNLAWIQQNYLEAAHYTDSALGDFITNLQSSGQLANTTIAIVGDHEAFIQGPADKTFAQALGYPGGFNDLTYLQSRQVPFLVYNSGLPATQLDGPASQTDIYPTLMNLMGLKAPASALGQDLLNDPDPLVARRRRGSGIDLEFAMDRQHTYLGAASSSQYAAGTCYAGANLSAPPTRVSLDQCRSLYDRAYNRIRLSDLVVQGNALDLIRQ